MKLYSSMFFFCVMVIMVAGCTGLHAPPTPPARVPLADLLIPESSYPANWHSEGIEKNQELASEYVENVAWSFRYKDVSDNASIYRVVRYPSSETATQGYDILLHYFHRSGLFPVDGPILIHTKLVHASRQDVICSSEQFCMIFAHYQEYVLTLSVHITPPSMTEQQVEQLLILMDTYMAPVASP